MFDDQFPGFRVVEADGFGVVDDFEVFAGVAGADLVGDAVDQDFPAGSDLQQVVAGCGLPAGRGWRGRVGS